MSERAKQPEKAALRDPLHLIKCAGELVVMRCVELVHVVNDAHDCFGEDSPEDQAIRSGRWA